MGQAGQQIGLEGERPPEAGPGTPRGSRAPLEGERRGPGRGAAGTGPRVSVVIPVYNGGNYLREAIDSALGQTYGNTEVIVVNDGSADGGATEEIALSYGARIKYLRKENGGTASALNVGIRNMGGEYFSWLSHDDIYYPDKIKREVEEAMASGDGTQIVQCEYDFYDEGTGTRTPTDFHKHYPAEQLTDSVFSLLQLQIHGCGALIHRSHFQRAGLFNERLRCTQDIDMWFRLLRGQRSLWVPERLFQVRLHGESDSKRHEDVLNSENARLYCQFMEEMPDEELASLYGTAETGLCRMAGLIRSRGGSKEAEALERRLEGCYRRGGHEEEIARFKRRLEEMGGGREREVVIFGAGQFGRRVLYELRQRQVEASCFMDNDEKKDGARIDGVECRRVESFASRKEDVLVIIAQRMCGQAIRQMEELGFPHVVTKPELDGVMVRYPPWRPESRRVPS